MSQGACRRNVATPWFNGIAAVSLCETGGVSNARAGAGACDTYCMGSPQPMVLTEPPARAKQADQHARPESRLGGVFGARRPGAGRTLLVLGIALRILVFCFLAPINNDRG